MTAVDSSVPTRKLLKDAEMDIYAYNTGVVMSADDTFRINVTNGHVPMYGDHVAIMIGDESQERVPFVWRLAHFTPARARVIAHHLIRIVDWLDAKAGK